MIQYSLKLPYLILYQLVIIMEQSNLKNPLIMKYSEIPYEPVQTEGQCILKSVISVRFNQIKFVIFCVISVIFLGLPVVLAYWYPKFKLWLYYDKCYLLQCTHFSILNYDDQTTITQKKQQVYFTYINEQQSDGFEERIIYFINRYMKYRIISNQTGIKVTVDIFNFQKQIRKLLEQNFERRKPIRGYQQRTVQELRRRFGPGTMIIDRPGLLVLFFRQIVQPLYFFLVASMVIWISENYYYYCFVIFVTTVVGATLNLYQTYNLNNKIYDMAYYQVNVNVLRGSQVVNISSKDVVPGDIVFLDQSIKTPFDGIILENSALLNQSALTGQSVPVVRKAEDLGQLLKGMRKNPNYKIPLKNNLIFEGNTLIQVDKKKPMQLFQQYRNTYGVPVYVIRTNFVTLKGQLIRMISFPIEKTNIFEKQSMYFLIFLFILACISYALLVVRLHKYVQWNDMLQKFFDLVTVTVPPGLIVSMTFGIIHAVDKLKKKDIYCVSPNKVIMGGLVDLICFDKTGTLTQQYMDFQCFIPCQKGLFQNQIINPQADQINIKSGYSLVKLLQRLPNVDMEHALTNMATNHTLTNILSTGQNVGDPMQLRLFEFGQYRFNDEVAYQQKYARKGEPIVFGFQSSRGHYGVVFRRMDFDPQLLRMSAIAKSSIKQDPGSCYLYTKGSPQTIFKICLNSTLPNNYQQVLKYYASSGFRVLAICHKRLQPSQINEDRMEIQKGMIFDGFQVFQNKLKPQTKGALRQLTIAQIPCVMITGDNALTASNIAYKSGIVSIKKQIHIFNYKQFEKELQIQEFKANFTPQQIQEANLMEKIDKEEEPHQIQLQPIPYHQQINSLQKYEKLNGSQAVDYVMKRVLSKISSPYNQVCLTGSTFHLLFNGIDLALMDEERKSILRATKIYARAKPNQKAKIIMAYQQGLRNVVSMCGDGANDCGALKQSDAGLSLSQSQASISAPFTSKITNIGSMVELIKQCRGGLITNFSLFNIMALYSLIQYTTSVICQFHFTYPSDFQFLYWDLFGNFFFFILFGYTQTADRLTKQKPARSLFTLTNLVQVLIMHLIQLAGQFLMIISLSYFFSEELNYSRIGGSEINYQKYVANDKNFVLETPQASILFLFTNFMYIFSFIAFSISDPWRKSFYTNFPFMVVLIFVFTYSVLLVILPASRLPLLKIVYMQHPLVNLFILLSALIFGSIMYMNQKLILQPIGKKLRLKYPNKLWI